MADRQRITMTRQAGTRFVGFTDDGRHLIIDLAPEVWEMLGRPDEFVLRVPMTDDSSS